MRFARSIVACMAAALALACVSAPAFAAPVPYVNSPMDTPQALVNQVVTSINATISDAAGLSTASGTTTSTCSGLRCTVSITGLTTAAAGTSSAAMTVTNPSVAANSQVICAVNGYAGTGVPIATTIIPGAGNYSFTVTNVAASGALNATVPVACAITR